MARDMVAVMARLGHERFAVAGHDRGGRVAYPTTTPPTVTAAAGMSVPDVGTSS